MHEVVCITVDGSSCDCLAVLELVERYKRSKRGAMSRDFFVPNWRAYGLAFCKELYLFVANEGNDDLVNSKRRATMSPKDLRIKILRLRKCIVSGR